MTTARRLTVFLCIAAAGISRCAAAPVPHDTRSLPQYFEANQGQAARDIDFVSRGVGYTVFLKPDEADFELCPAARQTGDTPDTALRMKLLGANAQARPSGKNLQSAKANYLIGNAPGLWHTGIPQFGRVEYDGVYPGIDLVYYGNRQQLEYDFILNPQADTDRIQLAFEGARAVRIDDETGDIVVSAGSAEIRQKKPAVYQDTPRGRKRIEGGYVALGGGRIGFKIAHYDGRKPLVIDPVLSLSSYFGGAGEDSGNSIAVDAQGDVYISGTTTSLAGRTSVAGQRFKAGSRAAYIAKIDPSGRLAYSTYIGGTNDQAEGYGLTVDKNGNAYLVGYTKAADFPTVHAFQSKLHGVQDAFVLELNSSGNALLFSSFLGGSGMDYLGSIAVDDGGNIYAAGATSSPDFPVLHAAQAKTPSRHFSAMALKIFPNRTVAYATYVGGENFANAVAIDATGDLYVAGDVSAGYFPCVHAFQKTYGGSTDGFVQKLSPTGAILYSTYLGGSGSDAIRGAKVDPSGNLIVAGQTTSSNFPVVNPLQRTLGGSMDSFVARLNAAGSALMFSTYIGGSDVDRVSDLALDDAGNLYLTGRTNSTNFPAVQALQAANAGGYDAFLTKIGNDGSAILFSTYLGGSKDDAAFHVAAGQGGKVYIVGKTSSANFPTVKAFQPQFGGGASDAFIAGIDLGVPPPARAPRPVTRKRPSATR